MQNLGFLCVMHKELTERFFFRVIRIIFSIVSRRKEIGVKGVIFIFFIFSILNLERFKAQSKSGSKRVKNGGKRKLTLFIEK